jgi:glycerophosphoryl diester phosphodiesterase
MQYRVLLFLSISIAVFLILFAIFTLLFYPSAEILTDIHYLGAHRGDSVNYIENTLPAFESALHDNKYSFIEFDIQYTKDKIIVVHHDLSLIRLQKKNYKIQDLTYDQLAKVSNYHIPTYEEVIDLVSRKKPLDIEIKSQGNVIDDLEIADFVISDLKKREILNTSVISSISFEVIQQINNKYNNRSNYYQYSDYWKQKRVVDTGLIYYVDESTFTRRIPLINELTELFRDTGFFDSMLSSWWLSGANYLMIHGSNIRQYNGLRPEIPFNSKIILWTFDDKMYLILPDKKIWNYESEVNGVEIPEVLPWWDE